MINGSSLGLYHMHEHIRKRVPQIVDEKVNDLNCNAWAYISFFQWLIGFFSKKELINITTGLDFAISNVTDVYQVVEEMGKIQELNSASDLLKNTLDLIPKK